MNLRKLHAAALAMLGFLVASRRVGAQVFVPPIVDFAPGAPTLYSPQLTAPAGTATFSPGSATSTAITVIPLGSGNYSPGFAHIVAHGGATEGYFAISGFTTSDTAVFALHLLVNGGDATAAQLNQIMIDINAADFLGKDASSVPAAYVPLIGPSYNLLLSYPPLLPNEGYPSYFAFDFNTETNVSGVSVTDVVMLSPVPEPSGAAAAALISSVLARRDSLRRIQRRLRC